MNDVLIVRDMGDYIRIRKTYPHLDHLRPKFVGQDLQRQLRGWVPDKIYVTKWATEHDDWQLVLGKDGLIPYRIAQGSELVCLVS